MQRVKEDPKQEKLSSSRGSSVQPALNHLCSLSLNFPICRTEMIMIPTHRLRKCDFTSACKQVLGGFGLLCNLANVWKVV